MNTIRNIPGIYAWTDVSRNKNVFKLGCASDILYRIQGEERKETSNIGTIKILFILECSHGNEKQFIRPFLFNALPVSFFNTTAAL